MVKKERELKQYHKCSVKLSFSDKHWQLPLRLLFFSSSFLKSARPTKALGFANHKSWGCTRQCPKLMTDFGCKLNKFLQKIAKCNPCLIYIYSQNLPQWPPSTKVGGHCGEIGVWYDFYFLWGKDRLCIWTLCPCSYQGQMMYPKIGNTQRPPNTKQWVIKPI